MKRIATVAIFLFVMTGISQGGLKWIDLMDGSEWDEMSKENKVSWVMGFIGGTNLVVSHYKISNAKGMSTLDEKEVKELYSIYLKNFLENQKSFGIYNVTIEQLLKGMDRFYQDERNKKIKMVDAVYVVKMEIENKRSELIEAQKKYLRLQPIDALTEATKLLIDYKNVKYTYELFLREGYFSEPRVDKPTKPEDYKKTPLFSYGDYR